MHCQYHGLLGNYASDLALLELEEPFEYSDQLLPACLSPAGYGDFILQAGAYGKIAGFGRTGISKSSDILVTLTAPYIPYDQCRSSVHDELNQRLMTIDKFCAGYTNGTCQVTQIRLMPVYLEESENEKSKSNLLNLNKT